MISFRMAVPVSILLVTLTAPSIGQTSDDTRKEVVSSMQAPSQVSTAGTTPADRKLTPEELGDLYMARKQYREASEEYKRLAEENPKNAVYLNKLGIALHQQSALGLALKYYQRAVKVDPQYADAENNIGTIWYQRKRYGKAIRAYQKAIKLRDDMPVLYSNLGYAYFSDGKYEEAITAFRVALSQDPGSFRLRPRTLLLPAGKILRSVGQSGALRAVLAQGERRGLYVHERRQKGPGIRGRAPGSRGGRDAGSESGGIRAALIARRVVLHSALCC